MVSAITNYLGVGANKPLATPLLDSAVWVDDLAVLASSYENVDFAFQHNGGVNDSQGDQHPYKFENTKQDIAITPQELSSTFLIPGSAYRQNKALLDQQLLNLANILLEAHLLYGGMGTKAFKDSPIKGALFYAKEVLGYQDLENFFLDAKVNNENTGGKVLNFDIDSMPIKDFHDPFYEDVDILPYGKLVKDCIQMDGSLPQDFVVNLGSNVLTGQRTPKINTKYLLEKNTALVTITWFVAGVPSSMNCASFGAGYQAP